MVPPCRRTDVPATPTLLVMSGSVVAAETRAVFVTVPSAWLLRSPVTVIVTTAPTAIVPSGHLMAVVPTGLHEPTEGTAET